MYRTAMAALGVASTVASCAPVQGVDSATPGERQGPCFVGNQVENFRIDGPNTVYIRSRQGDVFRLDTAAACFDAGAVSVGVTPRESPSQRICIGDRARVQVARSSSTPLTCSAQVSGPITDSGVSGLPSRS